MKIKSFFLLVLSLLISGEVYAQYESDTETIQSTIDALYEVISGDAGVERDWDRFKNLFAPDGRLIPTFTNQEGKIQYLSWSPAEYAERAGASLERDGFFESEIGQEVEQFGNIAQVFSTYDSRRTEEGEVFMRGINSIQLFNDGNRWWIVTVFWSSENPVHPIPPRYLNGEWVSLFDGETLDGWSASENEGTFSVENGIIKVYGDRSHLFYTGKVGNANFTDFEFRAKVMTENNSNSGIYFHTKYQDEGWPMHGYEVQVNNSYDVDPRRTGSLYGISDNTEITFADGEWMDYYIKVEGNHIFVQINGEVLVDYTQPEGVTDHRRISSGTFALQGHDPESTVYYKDLFVREL